MEKKFDLQAEISARSDEMQALLSKAEGENRAVLNADEKARFDQLESEIVERKEQLARKQKADALAAESFGKQPHISSVKNLEAEKPFSNLGEQLKAVYRHAQYGEHDARLHKFASGSNEAIGPEGGFLVQTDFVSQILKRTYEVGQVASRCQRIPLSANSNGIAIPAIDESSRATGSRLGGMQAYWLGETGTPTAAKPKLRMIEMKLRKLGCLWYATDELLADASALSQIALQGMADEIAFMLDDAVIRGDGANKPDGILNSAALVTVAKESGQTAATFKTENALKMYARLHPRSQQNAVWLINADVQTQLPLFSVAVGTGGMPVFMPPGGISGSQYATLLGRPIVPIEQCDTLGQVGDVILADLSQYLLIDKGGVESASSIHVAFLTSEQVFRVIYRVNGQPTWNSAVTPYKGSNTLSPFVTLAIRS